MNTALAAKGGLNLLLVGRKATTFRKTVVEACFPQKILSSIYSPSLEIIGVKVNDRQALTLIFIPHLHIKSSPQLKFPTLVFTLSFHLAQLYYYCLFHQPSFNIDLVS